MAMKDNSPEIRKPPLNKDYRRKSNLKLFEVLFSGIKLMKSDCSPSRAYFNRITFKIWDDYQRKVTCKRMFRAWEPNVDFIKSHWKKETLKMNKFLQDLAINCDFKEPIHYPNWSIFRGLSPWQPSPRNHSFF